jgi:hypothetical protein
VLPVLVDVVGGAGGVKPTWYLIFFL